MLRKLFVLGWLYGMKERVSAHFRFSFFFLEEQIAVNGLMDGLVIDVIRKGVPPFQSPPLVWKKDDFYAGIRGRLHVDGR